MGANVSEFLLAGAGVPREELRAIIDKTMALVS